MAEAPFETIDEDEVEALGCAVFAWQRARCAVIARVAEGALGGSAPASLAEVPAIPTDVFKVARVACFPESAAVRVFETSGTTQEVHGRHAFADLSLYASASCATAARWLLPQRAYRCVYLAEPEELAPASSLSFMLGRFAERWHCGEDDPWMVRGASLDARRRGAGLRRPGRLLRLPLSPGAATPGSGTYQASGRAAGGSAGWGE